MDTLNEAGSTDAAGNSMNETKPYLSFQIPGYEIISELGHGGMGVVYLARQVRLNRLVALKMIRDSKYGGKEAQERFFNEAEVIAKLQHPGIVQIYEFGVHEEKAYFVLEYLRSGSLDRKLNGKPLPFKAAAILCKQLADSVQAAHELAIIHRDLKPANILLTDKGEPKITDFGLAKRNNSDMTGSFAQMGTPSYMAPELAAGKAKDVGPTCDIFSLGATFYEMLTGQVPFKGATPLETMRLVIEMDPVSIQVLQPGTPEALVTICQKCLQKDPKDRYQTALELAEDVDRFLQNQPIVARPVGQTEKAWRWSKKNPRIVGLAAMTIMVLVFVGVFLKSKLGSVNSLPVNTVDNEVERINAAISRVTNKPSRHADYDEGMQKLNALANDLQNKRDFVEAEKSFRVLYEMSKAHSPPSILFTVELQYHLGTCLMLLGRYEEAEKNLLECNDQLKNQKVIPLDWPVNICNTLIELYQCWNRPELVEKWKEEQARAFRVWIPTIPRGTQERYDGLDRFANLLESINQYSEATQTWTIYYNELLIYDPDGLKKYEIGSALGKTLLVQKKYTEAEDRLIKSYQGMKAHSQHLSAAERKSRLEKLCQRIVLLYQTWGKRVELEEWQKELVSFWK